MFKNTINALRELGQTKSYSMQVLPDKDGFFDKECPNDECLSKFKVNADDWKNLFRDEAARTCDSLVETSVSDLVVAFQRLCECLFQEHFPSVPVRRNAFQNLDEGSSLWKDETGEGYDNWLDERHIILLRRCFQQRHLLQHAEGIVDQSYIDRSGDSRYTIGQRLIIDASDVLSYAKIIEIMGEKVLSLVQE